MVIPSMLINTPIVGQKRREPSLGGEAHPSVMVGLNLGALEPPACTDQLETEKELEGV
eukprot:m.2995 g.2995  ORF g.2995 m.2995 type:complete len:58 (+) comp4298_c0_seq1:808-981(+)